MRRPGLLTALAPLLCWGTTCGPAEPPATAAVRFVLETGDAAGPIFVQLNTQGDQPAWIRVSNSDGGPVFLRERCEIADCGAAPAVCGAALTLVQDIAARGSVELAWDGLDSVIDPTDGCERRVPAAAGRYVATFCYGRAAQLLGEGDVTTGVQGTVPDPVCADVPFRIPDDGTVRYRIPDGG